MRKLKERFHKKHGIVSRIFSMVLALAMIVTMVPAIGNSMLTKAASNPMNVTIHFMEQVIGAGHSQRYNSGEIARICFM